LLTQILQRLLMVIPLLLVVSFLVFLMIHLSPGDPARLLAGEQADLVTVQNIAARLGLDRPLHVQYGRFLQGLVQGDLGRSIHTRQPVFADLLNRLGATARLAFVSLAFATLLGTALGTIAATFRNTWIDICASLLALLGLSLPAFWLALMLMYFFSLKLGWLPTAGYGGLAYYVLPAITLGTRSLAVISRLTRAEMLTILGEDYVRTARAKGLRVRGVIIKHALRNALVAVVTIVGLQMGQLLAGSVGLGRQLILGILGRDFPVIQGGVLFIATSFILVNLIVDVLYGVIDPRVRYA
jgi:glutathione transport system permease protein